MRFPHRSIHSIQAIPSIHTAFDPSYVEVKLNESPAETASQNTGDGIEVVPIERQSTSCAKIVSPGHEEKEVVVSSVTDIERCSKPLPALPLSTWSRIFARKRNIAIFFLFFLSLLSIGLALVFVRSGSPKSHSQPKSRSPTGNDTTSSSDDIASIQRGIFAFHISSTEQQSSGCLGRSNESVAWQCATDSIFKLNILPSSSQKPSLTMVSLGPPAISTTLAYGPQIPIIEPIELTSIDNSESTEDGPAYRFRTTFTRTVFLREEELSVQESETGGEAEVEPPTIEKGDVLWQCTFDETNLEGSIYINKASSSSGKSVPLPGSLNPLQLPYLPYVTRLTEQKSVASSAPYCQKMEMMQDGTMKLQSEKMMLDLTETRTSRRKRRQNSFQSSCKCQWTVQ